MTLEGIQTHVRVSSHGEPGLVENSINSMTGGDDQDGHPEHHHDDVVEHLDVIGTQIPFTLLSYPSSESFLIDSQIGAFSNLTNAANSIIM